MYSVTIASEIYDDFEIQLDCINAEKKILTYLPNPKYSRIKKKIQKIWVFEIFG